MIKFKDLTFLGRRRNRADDPGLTEMTEERLATLAWLCMTASLLAALLLAAYEAV
jgi:hypothetical protein